MPLELLTTRLSIMGRSQRTTIRRLFCSGWTSKLAQVSPCLRNFWTLKAWMEDVLAPESTRALMAGRPRSGKAHHSSLPMICLEGFSFMEQLILSGMIQVEWVVNTGVPLETGRIRIVRIGHQSVSW